MEIALGILGWTPATLWSATPHEFWAAWDGWCRLNVPKRDDEPEPEAGLSPEDHDFLRKWMDAERIKEQSGRPQPVKFARDVTRGDLHRLLD